AEYRSNQRDNQKRESPVQHDRAPFLCKRRHRDSAADRLTPKLAILMPSFVQLLRRGVRRHPAANASGLRYNNLERPRCRTFPAIRGPLYTSVAFMVAGSRSTW